MKTGGATNPEVSVNEVKLYGTQTSDTSVVGSLSEHQDVHRSYLTVIELNG